MILLFYIFHQWGERQEWREKAFKWDICPSEAHFKAMTIKCDLWNSFIIKCFLLTQLQIYFMTTDVKVLMTFVIFRATFTHRQSMEDTHFLSCHWLSRKTKTGLYITDVYHSFFWHWRYSKSISANACIWVLETFFSRLISDGQERHKKTKKKRKTFVSFYGYLFLLLAASGSVCACISQWHVIVSCSSFLFLIFCRWTSD